MSLTAAGNKRRLLWREPPRAAFVFELAFAIFLLLITVGWPDTKNAIALPTAGGFVSTKSHADSTTSLQPQSSSLTIAVERASPFDALAAHWDAVWSIDIASAERNEINIIRARDLRAKANTRHLTIQMTL